MKIPGMKDVLAAEIAEVLPNITSEVAVNFIETAHQKPIESPELQKEREPLCPYLVAKIKSWDTEELKSASIKANQSDTSRVFVFQIYSKALTIRRNEVLKL